ncbi:MAG: hypothetical protein OEQ39_02970 [Gammaproteobacteria bacterium]|nr:hypothetical protein [Gammaproteobacteria bacterium]MDH3375912.1 hypothetical protein [Gammaproteobacteria bacterium]
MYTPTKATPPDVEIIHRNPAQKETQADNLRACPDCARRISKHATACPSCGAPLAAQVIEATAKRWKAGQVYGWFAVVFGLTVWFFGFSVDNPSVNGFGTLAVIAGFITVFVARIAAWWENG